ncbi:MAG: DNA repair protein RadC [Syntrophorhabdales bacterium]|jgi:DNA repair protein RadC
MENPFTIHDLPRAERPRERLKALGAEALSAQELLTLIIGRGIPGRSAVKIAQELLTTFGSIHEISRATIEELSSVKGIGLARAVQFRAAFELGRRQDLEPDVSEYSIKDPEGIVKAIRKGIVDKAKEHFKLVLLNTRNRIIGISTISVGTLNTSLVHPPEVFRDALMHSASAIILVHNHPSDDPEPSETDLAITRMLAEAGRLMGIEVLDHIIITRKRYASLKDKGLL